MKQNLLWALQLVATAVALILPAAHSRHYFNRISSFLICSQIDPTCNNDDETVAEIVRATKDGMTLVYTDSSQEKIGFVDISDPSMPVGAGAVAVGGEPTSLTVKGNELAIVAVNTAENFIDVSGSLKAVSIKDKKILNEWPLPGQPNAIAISPDGNYLCIAIENERDEDLGDGSPPQLPPGSVVVVDSSSDDLKSWTATTVDVTGLAGLRFPEDPEPEFVHINSDNICVVTFQENNGIALVDLKTGSVIDSFSAGSVNLDKIDTKEEDVISQTLSLADVLREPDGVTFIEDGEYFATADEGDLDGGSRGFTIFDLKGNVVYSSGSDMEHVTAGMGHYPESRSENKGNEPENVAFGVYGKDSYLFVNSERSSLSFVYKVKDVSKPKLLQVLPTSVGPEGGETIPSRDLFVVACEVDSRDSKMRSAIVIYERQYVKKPQYPTLVSKTDYYGVPIPWGALSGLAPVPGKKDKLYTIEDSYYKKSRFFTIHAKKHPAMITSATRIKDSYGIFANISVSDGSDDDYFTKTDLDALINEDMTVNIDSEGIVGTPDGKYVMIASEGRGTIGDSERPIESLNFIFKVKVKDGSIHEVLTLPDEVNKKQVRYGFEGVSLLNDYLIVAFQRAWRDEAHPYLGIYGLETKEWKFLYYPLDAPESQNGGWVGLSDITLMGKDGTFIVLERDNQGGPDAAIKKLYSITVGETFEDIADGTTVSKIFARDLMPDIMSATKGTMLEKIEGLAYDPQSGEIWINNDNDGVDDNSGETQLLNLGYFVGKSGPRLRG